MMPVLQEKTLNTCPKLKIIRSMFWTTWICSCLLNSVKIKKHSMLGSQASRFSQLSCLGHPFLVDSLPPLWDLATTGAWPWHMILVEMKYLWYIDPYNCLSNITSNRSQFLYTNDEPICLSQWILWKSGSQDCKGQRMRMPAMIQCLL